MSTSFYWRVTDELDPVTGSVDLSELVGPAEMPQVVGLTYWVSTVGGGSAGGYGIDVTWEDAQGQTRIVAGTPLSLQTLDSLTIVPQTLIMRGASDAPLSLTTTLNGVADGAKIRYALLVSPGAGEGNVAI